MISSAWLPPAIIAHYGKALSEPRRADIRPFGHCRKEADLFRRIIRSAAAVALVNAPSIGEIRMNPRALWTGVVLAASAVTVFAALTPAKAEWGKGPVQAIMTAEEAAAWTGLQSDAEADSFIELFWARRDPTPGTPQNEYRNDFEVAVKAADAQFSYRHVRGSMTDPGRILLLFGPPTHAKRTTARAGGSESGRQPSGRQQLRTTEIGSGMVLSGAVDMKWTYEGANTQQYFGKSNLDLSFHDQYGDGEFKLALRDVDLTTARRRAIQAAITQPQLTEAPSIQRPAEQTPAAGTGAAADRAVKSAALEAALVAAQTGRPASSEAVLSYAEFVSPSGDSYVPVQIYVPAAAAAGARDADTIFGAVDDTNGNRVASFEERASLTASKSDFFADKTLALPAGKYHATVGLARDGQPLVLASGPIEVSRPAKDSAGTSRLILSNNIYVGPNAEPAKAPFAFGRLKIVPKGDLRFTNTEDLNYFVEINNPGIDPATNMPKILCQLDLTGGGTTTSAPLTDAPVLSLTGKPGPGHYAMTSSIPLGQVRPALIPGDYTLKMKIVDSISKQSYDLEQSFKITHP
jgi:GWxTD domain-containing protein